MKNIYQIYLRALVLTASILIPASASAQSVLYIYGDVAANGTTPSGPAPSFEPMRLNDTGATGISQFRDMVQAEGYSITEANSYSISLNASLLNQYDVIVFGLHQKIWSAGERNALGSWLQNGGGMLVYSDSAAGGSFGQVGAQNSTGQNAVKNLISQYGMQVTVDQAHGVPAMRATGGGQHPIVSDSLIFEGEGVSPVVVNTADSAVQILIPFNAGANVSGPSNIVHTSGITIPAGNRAYASMALRPVGSGNIIASFDRQPMWNSGPGSDINKRDNKEILRRAIRFLAGDNPTGNGSGNGSTVTLRRRSAMGFAIDGNNGGANNQNVYMWGFDPNNVNQQWEEISRGGGFYTYKKKNTIYTLDGGGGPASNDDNIYLWAEGAGNQNQHWKKIGMGGGYYRLEKRNAPSHSIDGGGGAGFNGQNVKLWQSDNNNWNQHWFIQ